MSKPENTFRRSVHKHFHSSVLHQEKMANPYSSGTADDWYSGKPQRPRQKTRDLWIEWKFVVLPVRDDTMIDLVSGRKPDLSALQQLWLEERYKEGRNVWVGLGSTKGGVLLKDLQWQRPLSAGDFRARLMTREQLAEHIVSYVQGQT